MPASRVGCSLGPRVSRFRVPGGVDEAMAAASWRNKSSRSLPRPVGALLRRRRRARGGGTPCVESLYRSLRSTPILLGVRRGKTVSTFCFQGWRGSCGFCGGVEDGSCSNPPWWCLASLTTSSDPRPRALGAWPRPIGVQRRLISFFRTSVYFGSTQSLRAMGPSRFWGWWRLVAAAPGEARWRSLQAARTNTGFKGLFAISILSWSLCANRFGQLSSVSYSVIPVFLWVFVRSP